MPIHHSAHKHLTDLRVDEYITVLLAKLPSFFKPTYYCILVIVQPCCIPTLNPPYLLRLLAVYVVSDCNLSLSIGSNMALAIEISQQLNVTNTLAEAIM